MVKKGNRVIKGSLRALYRWHRRIGLVSLIFVLVLTITGLLLNHNAELNFHKKHIQSQWVHQWYGLPAPEEGGFEGLTVDRVLLDIHTGRFFGSYGHYVMDIAAILFLILSVTGFYMWYRRYSEQRKRQK